MDTAVFHQVVDRLAAFNVESVIVSESGETLAHHAGEPQAMNIRSLSKPTVILALGAAIADGLELAGTRIGLDTPVLPLLERYATVRDPANRERWARVTFRHLFSMGLGQPEGLMFRSTIPPDLDPARYVDFVVNQPITAEPGTRFCYSNACPFLVSTLIQEHLGTPLADLVDRYLLAPLGIADWTWSRLGAYTAGATGLHLVNEDLHKLARLIAQDGAVDGRRLVPAAWLDEMRTPQTPTPLDGYDPAAGLPKWGYGLGLWLTGTPTYYCYGTDGQYIAVFPETGRVVTVLGDHNPDLGELEHALALFG